MRSQVTAFVSRRWRVPSGAVSVAIERLHGGLESAVARAYIRYERPRADQPSRLVIKALHGRLAREADVYDALRRHMSRPPTALARSSELVYNTSGALRLGPPASTAESCSPPRAESGRSNEPQSRPPVSTWAWRTSTTRVSIRAISRVIRTTPACRPRDPDAL